MKKIIVTCFLIALLLCDCNHKVADYTMNGSDISRIELINRTPNKLIPDRIILTDPLSISGVVTEINHLEPIDEPNVKANVGLYEMEVVFKDKSWKRYDVIYTRYDGVVVNGSGGFLMNKYYKNDRLEMLILSLFIKNTQDK